MGDVTVTAPYGRGDPRRAFECPTPANLLSVLSFTLPGFPVAFVRPIGPPTGDHQIQPLDLIEAMRLSR
jgi:hypothetical protein